MALLRYDKLEQSQFRRSVKRRIQQLYFFFISSSVTLAIHQGQMFKNEWGLSRRERKSWWWGRAGDGGELETERCPHVIRLAAGYIDLVMDDNREIKTNMPLSAQPWKRECETARPRDSKNVAGRCNWWGCGTDQLFVTAGWSHHKMSNKWIIRSYAALHTVCIIVALLCPGNRWLHCDWPQPVQEGDQPPALCGVKGHLVHRRNWCHWGWVWPEREVQDSHTR